MATNTPFPYATPFQTELEGITMGDHVIPSVDLAATVVALDTTATKTPFP
jgi:hypothetical protein